MPRKHIGAVPVFVLLVTGCNSDDKRLPLYPVSGKVLFNGAPAEGATVIFIPATEEMRLKKTPAPKARVQADGKFKLETYSTADGAPAGDYWVSITWVDELTPGDDPESFDPKDKLNGKYDLDHSELKATVPEKAVEIPPFELK